jgi:hypothetical protein
VITIDTTNFDSIFFPSISIDMHVVPLQSSHWNEHRSTFKQDAIAELKKIKFVAPPDNEMNIFPDKYCLFWMCNFPTLLLETWNNFKDVVNH